MLFCDFCTYYRTPSHSSETMLWVQVLEPGASESRCLVPDSETGTGQLVPKSTRTLVNSYPFLVNSYLGQLVPKSTRTLVYL